TFNPQTETGVKNWIATIPYLGLGAKYSPYYISDPALKLVQLHHHDGHRSNISYSIAIKNQIYKQLSSVTNVGNQTVAMTTDSFPTTVNSNTVKNGDYLIRTDLQATTTSLYRYNLSGMWELVNIDIMLAKILLSFEQALFDNLPVEMKPLNFNPIYDVGANTTNPQYNNLIRHQFSNYIKNNDVTTPFSSTNIFKANNPFTWNYAYTPVSIHPVSGLAFTNVSAAWQALYTQIYGTPYPHREPWVLQGYIEKPLWWDRVYIDTTGTRHWKATMWNNIFAGIIPLGQFTPNGSFGTGKSNQISTLFKFVSVNVDPNPTRDGILPDGLLPPFWNTRNSTNTKVRSLYDPNLQHFITTPQADYIFGQNGPYEWEWNVSAQRLYDDLTVSFEIDPMKFVYLTFGINFINVNCLQVDKDIQRVFSHKDTVFHGDFIASTNTVYKSNGLNQWYIHYNRYNGFDDVNSGFKSLWQGWDIDLSYLFNSFIDTSNFIISSDIFDLSDKDYSVSIKKTQGISDMWLDALKGTVLNVPSKFIQNRDNSIEWSVQFNNTSPIGRNLLFYAPEDYNFRVIPKSVSPFSADTFRIYSYNIVDVGIENSYAYRIVSYNQGLSGIAHTNLTNDNFEYSFKISVNGGQLIPYSIKGKDAQTYDALVEQINIKLNGLATASIIDGNLRIKSNTFGNTSSINVVDNGLFVSASPTLYNSVSDQILSTITFLNYFILNGNKTNIFNVGDSIGVTNSTNFNGTYTVSNITFDIPNARTIITVREHITISSLIVDGVLEPLNAKTLPDTWKTGTQINLNTTGILPSSLDETTPYYVIIVNDREFRLSTSQIGALNGA
ncbi:MAG: hypothetical protein JWP44_4258, partial [Mucilaginibacter sp.]|nr:hypothetical protein [Mucilaginibacter sp.]